MNIKRYGRQEPTVGFTLAYTHSQGGEAIGIYEKSGRKAMPWQQSVIYDMTAIDDDGLWTHSRYGFSVPRQNGKNEVISIRELCGLQNGERILHTAHRTSTSRAAWERLCFLLEESGIHEIKGKNRIGYTSGKSKGQEFIYMSKEFGGGRIQFRTRSTTGGLGETYDLLVIDEAQEYQPDQQSALKYTIVSSENPQTVYLGTPPTAYSSGTIFPSFRKKTLCGDMKHAGWAEWSIEQKTSDISNVDLWYETNPSLGYTLTERAIEDELEGDADDFNVQRLGLWVTYNQKSEISQADWHKCYINQLPKLVGKLSVGIKIKQDGSVASLSVAVKTDEGKTFVESIGSKSTREGFQWIIDFLVAAKDGINKIVVDGKSGVDILQSALKDAGIKIIVPTTDQYIKANSLFVQGIYAQDIQHMGQPSLIHAATNCEKRLIGSSGGFGFRSLMESAEISLLDSVILAQWAVDEYKEAPKKQKIVY